MQVDSDEEQDQKAAQQKEEENKEGDEIMGEDAHLVNKRPHRVKTHIEIDDVSIIKHLIKWTTSVLIFYFGSIFIDIFNGVVLLALRRSSSNRASRNIPS